MRAPPHGTTGLVVQWLRIHLAVQGTQVLSLAGELRCHMPRGNWVCVPLLLSLQGLHQNNPRDTAKIPMCCNQDPTKPKKKVKKKKNFFLKRETPGSSLLLLQVRMQWQEGHLQTRKWVLTRHGLSWHLDLEFANFPELWEINLCSHPVYGIFVIESWMGWQYVLKDTYTNNQSNMVNIQIKKCRDPWEEVLYSAKVVGVHGDRQGSLH